MRGGGSALAEWRPSVCSLFLNGFPYNWDNYAGACFEGKFSSASVLESAASANELSEGFADAEGCLFPVHSDDLSPSWSHAEGCLFPIHSDDFSLPVPISLNYGHESEFLKSSNTNTTQSDTIIGIHSSKEKILDLSISKIQNNQSRKKQQSPLSVCRAYKKDRSLHSSGRAIWRPRYGDMHQLVFQAQPNITHCLRIRLCLCCLTYIFYLSPSGSPNLNGEIMGITCEGLENFACIESQSEPPRKRKRLV